MKVKIITVIPVYNGEAFIVQTPQSLADQTLRPDRVIVQNNRSTDSTEPYPCREQERRTPIRRVGCGFRRGKTPSKTLTIG